MGKGRSRDESEFWFEPDGEDSERRAREEAKHFSVDVFFSAHSPLLPSVHSFLPLHLSLISGISWPASLL